MRSCPQDFRVEELLAPPNQTTGPVLWLQVEKVRLNTRHVADTLADFAGLERHEVGYAGLKDKGAVAVQWFSLPAHADHERLAENQCHRVTDWGGRFTVRSRTYADYKLRQDEHSGNRFSLRLRALRGKPQDLDERLNAIRTSGVPNYFGRQRFGQNEENLVRARRWLQRRKLPRGRTRGFIVGAARGWVFNHVLAWRTRQGTWDQTLEGESESSASGPLWGRGRNPVRGETLRAEQAALDGMGLWLERLEHSGSRLSRRSLICQPGKLSWTIDRDDLHLTFELGPGEYATNLLNHCFGDLREARCGDWDG